MTFSRRDFLLTTGALVALAGPANAAGWRMPPRQKIKVIENIWIPLADGTRLGLRLWLPESAEHTPVPVVWEYLPYRKRDLERGRDSAWGESFAPCGFAYARVDIRGSGDSDGVLLGEYLQQEQNDGVEVIAWLARQPWCTGAVGMRGISWGGFNSLQIAALAPPALKAIMTHCATDNRFTDDAHYVGGALTLDDMDWGAQFKNVLVGPPDPEISGEGWHQEWLARLEATPPVLAQWLSHQRYDAFWQHGSVAVDYAAIKCPVYAVGGQIDSYRDFLPRLLANLQVPRKGLMGPWGHKYPQIADPGPGLDWVHEEVRWWTQWLKGVDTGIMAEPMLRAYMETRTASEVWPKDVPGRWVAEQSWPAAAIAPLVLHLNEGVLAPDAGAEKILTIRSAETIGLTKREWFPWNLNIDLPPDQTPDDRRSLVFETAPLPRDIEILGNPTALIRVAADQPVAKLALRLNEVTPDGKSWNVSYGVLNLTHRDGHEHPAPLVPGQHYDVKVSCYFTAHRFKQGSRIRLAVTESIWPLVWPSPKPVVLSLTGGVSTLSLPVRPRETGDQTPPIPILRDRIEQAVTADPKSLDNYRVIQTGPDADGLVTIQKILRDPPETLADIGTVMEGGSDWTMQIREGDPNSGVWRVEWFSRLTRGAWDTETRSILELTSTEDSYRMKESIRATEGGKIVFERAWDNTIKRDLA
jgi:putative CocE/NonD family hydrolase